MVRKITAPVFKQIANRSSIFQPSVCSEHVIGSEVGFEILSFFSSQHKLQTIPETRRIRGAYVTNADILAEAHVWLALISASSSSPVDV